MNPRGSEQLHIISEIILGLYIVFINLIRYNETATPWVFLKILIFAFFNISSLVSAVIPNRKRLVRL